MQRRKHFRCTLNIILYKLKSSVYTPKISFYHKPLISHSQLKYFYEVEKRFLSHFVRLDQQKKGQNNNFPQIRSFQAIIF